MSAGNASPWEPASLVLRVGDRVRVRLSGECRSWIHDNRLLLSDCECGYDGDEGTVERIHDAERDRELIDMMGAEGHVYYVQFGRCSTAEYGNCASSFARAELERVR